MKCNTFPLEELKNYKYVVILSYYHGKIMLSRHKARTTWETQGGHIERGEHPMLPVNLTYPGITPILFGHAEQLHLVK